jgi:hypothetical protein
LENLEVFSISGDWGGGGAGDSERKIHGLWSYFIAILFVPFMKADKIKWHIVRVATFQDHALHKRSSVSEIYLVSVL